jgi:tetrahydromethanopterin S-methyltransferase subunit F
MPTSSGKRTHSLNSDNVVRLPVRSSRAMNHIRERAKEKQHIEQQQLRSMFTEGLKTGFQYGLAIGVVFGIILGTIIAHLANK